MPIFAYRCQSCGFEKDALQKRSDAPLVDCPACHRDTFARQLTAPAFQLKGSGWYVTDFRENGKGKPKPAESGDGAPGAPAAAAAEGTPGTPAKTASEAAAGSGGTAATTGAPSTSSTGAPSTSSTGASSANSTGSSGAGSSAGQAA